MILLYIALLIIVIAIIAAVNSCYSFKYLLFYSRMMLTGKRLYGRCDTHRATGDGIVISLTTIPSRIHNIFPALNSLLLQSRPAGKIYLNLPETSVREKKAYHIPAILKDDQRITIHRCKEDYGPLTKLLPVLDLALHPDTVIITVDDDTVYHPDMVKTMMMYHDRLPQAALGFRGWNIPASGLYEDSKTIFANQIATPQKVDILTGISGVLYLRKHFEDDIFDRDQLPPESFFVDDICISGYLEQKNVKRYLIPLPIREPLSSYIRTSNSNPLWKINKTRKNNQKMIEYFFENITPTRKEPWRLLKFYKDKVYKVVYPIYDEFFYTCNHYFRKKKAKPAVHRQVLLQLLTALDQYFKNARITYWLDSGTLLGCYREKKMIPYDRDIDVGILHRDHERALAGKEHLPDRFDLIEICRFWPYQKLFPFLNRWKRKTFLRFVDKKTGWFIDIFEYRETANGYKLLPWVFYHEHFDTYDHGLKRNCFPKDLIFPLQTGKYEQQYFPVPNKTKEVLEILYGKDYMKPDHIWDEENKQWRFRGL